jgi:hypothetical protein
MAKKKVNETEDEGGKKTPDKDLLKTLRERYKSASDADRLNRQKAIEDMRFVHEPGAQWDYITRKERGDRPCLEFNKLRVTIKRIINDMRSNRPQGKARPVEDSDVDTAEVYEGLIRNIWNVSDGDTVIDAAAEYQVAAGMGAWRICADYEDDDSFNQTLEIEEIKNPFCLYADPAAEDSLKRDARYWVLTSKMAKTAYEAKYPKAKLTNFDASEFDDKEDWIEEESVRICEYWWKEPVEKEILLLSNGATVDASTLDVQALAQEGLTVLKSRKFMGSKIRMCIASGEAVLEGPTDWAGCEFPFVLVYGENLILDGKQTWFGLVRFAKDAQRAYNYSRTAAAESIAMAPQAKWWATPEQAAGHTDAWAEAHKKNFPFMMYTPDAKAPGAPQRMGGPDVPVALMQQAQIDSEDIKAVTGIYDASLGNRSNETSGVAIRSRQAQGEIATFNYMDNLSKGIRRTWEILIDLIPHYYDTERAVRILGADGAEKYVRINQQVLGPDGQMTTLNDLSRGKYDVTVTVGPSFATQRQEAAETYSQLAQGNPALFAVAGDLIMKATDLPYANEVAERLKAMLPPPVQQILNKDAKQSPEAQQAMQQVDQAMQQVQQHGQMVQAAAAEATQMAQQAQSDQAQADKAKSEVQVAIANLKVMQANLSTQEAQFRQLIAETQLKMGEGQQTQDMANERAMLEGQLQTALGNIQQQAAEFSQQSIALMAQLHAANQPQVIVNNPPKRKVVHVKRVNGELQGTVEEVPMEPPQMPAPAMQ